ncbi:MAG: hypothetical protein QHJ82_17525, partial [Verrucomicrobiota bacterium]|nr:hypothetical protein [Verrucomicrobiota bacterium]
NMRTTTMTRCWAAALAKDRMRPGKYGELFLILRGEAFGLEPLVIRLSSVKLSQSKFRLEDVRAAGSGSPSLGSM